MHMACGFVMAAVALAVTSGASAQTVSEFKTLKIVVGFSTGGGYDTYARVLARHMGRHLAGTPGIIVQNMPGAASLKAIQYLDNGAPTDGSVITAFNPGTSRSSSSILTSSGSGSPRSPGLAASPAIFVPVTPGRRPASGLSTT